MFISIVFKDIFWYFSNLENFKAFLSINIVLNQKILRYPYISIKCFSSLHTSSKIQFKSNWIQMQFQNCIETSIPVFVVLYLNHFSSTLQKNNSILTVTDVFTTFFGRNPYKNLSDVLYKSCQILHKSLAESFLTLLYYNILQIQ